MTDDFLSSDWADSHITLSTALHRLIASIGDSFAALHHIHFDAPWSRD